MDSVAFEPSVIDAYPSRVQWDAAAADLVATMLERWHLTPREAFVGGEAASVLAVTTRDGEPAVLKVGFPHVEAIWEAVALDTWGAPLAPTVLRQDPWTWSMLLERIEPGTPLSRSGLPTDEALRVALELYRELSSRDVPAGVALLSDIVGAYVRDARSRLADQHADLAALDALPLVEGGLAEAEALAATDGADAFLHGDYNPGNLLLGHHGWVVIDPKPMLGDREFDLFPLLQQIGGRRVEPQPAAVIEQQLAVASSIIGCDAQRASRWARARAALDVTWYLEDGDRAAAAGAARHLRAWDAIVG